MGRLAIKSLKHTREGLLPLRLIGLLSIHLYIIYDVNVYTS